MTTSQSAAGLTTDDVETYRAQGFLVLPGVIGPGLVARLRDRIDALAAGAAPLPQGVARMEEPAVSRAGAHLQGAARVRKLEGVPLATDPVVAEAAHDPALVAVMKRLLGEDLKLLRAAAMLKPPRVGSAKGLHQDAAYYPIEPLEHVAAWIALDPATTENGCMEVLPGAHEEGLFRHETREYETDVVIAPSVQRETGLARLPMQPGDVLLTHCLTPHRSGPNQTGSWRRALILAYMSARSRYTVAEGERPTWVSSLLVSGRSYEGCV